MCMDDKEILYRVIKGFELVPAKRGFEYPYVTKTGAATPDLSKRINAWIKQNFPQSNIMTSYEGVYKAINFRRAMNERKIDMVKILAELGYNPLERREKPRHIYVYTFPPEEGGDGKAVKYAYVGLTDDLGKRHRQHVNPIKKNIAGVKGSSPVFRYAQRVGVQPHKEVITTEPVTEKEAVDLECSTIEKYKEEGWTMLNLAKCGSLGGSIRDEKAIINGIDDFVNSTSTDLKTLNLIPGSDYTTKGIETLGLAKEFFERLKEIIEANNITSTRQLRDREEVGRKVSKVIEDWSRTHRESDDWQKKLFPENTRGLERPQEGADAFLAEPSNLDRDQLKLITKRAWKGVKPEQEKAFLAKLKGIMDKNNVTDPAGLDSLAGNTTVTWMLSDHDKNSDTKWKPLLYRADYKSPKSRASVSESTVDSREILKRIIKSCCTK